MSLIFIVNIEFFLVTLTSRSFSKGSSKHENPVWITGADALMDSLKIHGVKVIFGYPGGAILPIYDAVHKAEQDGWLKHFMVRHEPVSYTHLTLPTITEV